MPYPEDEHELDEAIDRSEVETPDLEADEDDVAYDDGEDISEGAGVRPEAGVVPDDPGEE